MRLVTGFIYFATPSRMMSGFLVYGFLSLVGLLFFWRAYRTAISNTNDVRYLKWLVLLPSLLYWPSAIGKDAFMLLAAGIAAYGAACILSDRLWTGIGALTVGMLGMLMVRPHFALAACGGLMLALLFRRQRGGIVQTVVSVVFVVALGFVVVQSASSFFGISAFNQASVEKALNDASAQTGQGGSQFTPVIVNSPIKIPLAAITVLYRPFPFEAHSGQEMITALEGTVLVILTLKSWKQIKRALAAGRRMPYFLYCTGALLVFIIAFSGFSNFGILARERTVIQPLFLVFIALPADFDDQGAPQPEPKLPPPELGRALVISDRADASAAAPRSTRRSVCTSRFGAHPAPWPIGSANCSRPAPRKQRPPKMRASPSTSNATTTPGVSGSRPAAQSCAIARKPAPSSSGARGSSIGPRWNTARPPRRSSTRRPPRRATVRSY